METTDVHIKSLNKCFILLDNPFLSEFESLYSMVKICSEYNVNILLIAMSFSICKNFFVLYSIIFSNSNNTFLCNRYVETTIYILIERIVFQQHYFF